MRRLLLSTVLLALFGLSAWGGYLYHRRVAVTQAFNQNGWCCMLKKRTCTVQPSLASCKSAGGASFNWDQNACQSGCVPTVRRVPATTPKTP